MTLRWEWQSSVFDRFIEEELLTNKALPNSSVSAIATPPY
jgi:hypothetical protein